MALVRTVLFVSLLSISCLPLSAQSADGGLPDEAHGAITRVLDELGEEVRVYNEHITILASPWMEGRIPGSRGMEIAREYVEHYLIKAGCKPAFKDENGEASYRQAFSASVQRKVTEETFSLADGTSFEAGKDFMGSLMGPAGKITAPVVFAGYGIQRGREGFSSFSEDDDLQGKIAVVFRFEPMNEEGKSKWSRGRTRWSRYGGYSRKLRGLAKQGVAGVIVMNPPGCADPRTEKLDRGGRRDYAKAPVAMLSREASEKLVAKLDPKGRSLLELRKLADEGGACIPFEGEATISNEISRKPLMAENIGGLIPGRGELADEYVLIGAHIDHLGMGQYGSRSGAGKLHPGADDNASGTAALLMLADRINKKHASLPDDASVRSVLLVGFDAEEMGLKGAAHYVANPIAPLEKHALMINFDMIGRIKDKKLSVAGGGTSKGMKQWLDPILANSPLDIVQPKSVMMASDHAVFYQKQVPVLFAIITPFHNDYHTPRDTSRLINRVGGVQTVDLFEEITLEAAKRPEKFEFQRQGGRRRRVER